MRLLESLCRQSGQLNSHFRPLISPPYQASVAFMKWILDLQWSFVIIACLTIGLAPFNPPHIWEKLQMLAAGTLTKPIDIFDLLMHAAPWLLLIVKGILTLKNQ